MQMRIQAAGVAVRVAHPEREGAGAQLHISSVHVFCLDARLYPGKGSVNLWSAISWLEAQETTWTL